jgi:hypothetical protein
MAIAFDAYFGDVLRDTRLGALRNDSYVFWEMIRDVSGSTDASHWSSDRTHYHYQGRIMCEALFRQFGYSIAQRLANEMRKEHLRPAWIDAVVCPDETEAELLAIRLIEVLDRRQIRLVKIPRAMFQRVAGQMIPDDLKAELRNRYGANLDSIFRRNVVIVDQAVHQFGTFSALEGVCSWLECKVLAYVSFLDRTSTQFQLEDHLSNAAYLSLYKWSWPPSFAPECPCVSARRR